MYTHKRKIEKKLMLGGEKQGWSVIKEPGTHIYL